MIEEVLIQAVGNAPSTLILIYFLHLSFKQRESTMQMMTAIVKEFTRIIGECCDEENLSKSMQKIP